MGIFGGGDDKFIETGMRADGYGRMFDTDEDVMGCHAGDSAVLNIVNPRPGFVYQWCRDASSSILALKSKGASFVNWDDEDGCAAGLISELGAAGHSEGTTPQDSRTVINGVCLMRIPEENLARNREIELKTAEGRVKSGGQGYIAGMTQEEIEASGGRQSRFALAQHGTTAYGDTDERTETWRLSREAYERG